MNRIYIVTILLLVIALIFAIQNIAPIGLRFLFWRFEGSMALVTILFFITGFIAAWLLQFRKIWIKNSLIKTQQKKLNELEKKAAANTSTPSKSA